MITLSDKAKEALKAMLIHQHELSRDYVLPDDPVLFVEDAKCLDEIAAANGITFEGRTLLEPGDDRPWSFELEATDEVNSRKEGADAG